MTSNNKLIKNIFSIGFIQILNYVFPLITVPIVTRIIGPEKFGVINFANAYIGCFVLFIGYGFEITATRRIAKNATDTANRSQVFSEVFFAQLWLLLFSLVFFIFSLLFVPVLKDEKTVAVFTFTLCIGTVFTQNWLFQAMQDLSKIAILSLVTKILFTFFIIISIRKASDYIWQPFAIGVAFLITGVISFFWSIKKYSLTLKKTNFKNSMTLLFDEKTVFLSVVVINLYTTANIIILGMIRDSSEVGYYTASQKIIQIFNGVVSMTLTQAFFPFIGKAFGESREKGIAIVQKILPIVFYITIVIGIISVLLGPIIINIFFGGKFKEAIPAFRILAFLPLVVAMSTTTGIHIMMNLKMDKTFLKITAIAGFCSILLNIIFIKIGGYIGAAIALLLIECGVSIAFYLSLKFIGINVIKYENFKFSVISKTLRSQINTSN